MRYEMRLDRPWRPLLAIFGGTPTQSYVEIEGRTLRFRYGWGFRKEVPLDEVAGARTGRRWRGSAGGSRRAAASG